MDIEPNAGANSDNDSRNATPSTGAYEPNSEIDFIDSEYSATFSGSIAPHKINLQDLGGFWEVKGIFQAAYESATVTFAWGGQPRPEGFIDPTPEHKYYSFELRRRQKSE